MVAAPQYSTFTFKGRSGRTYIKDAYFSDVANAMVNWDAGAGASSTSPTDWVPNEPVMLVDFSVVTGLTDTTKVQLTRNGIATGDMLRYSIHLTTLAYRPQLRIPFNPGQRIQFIQKA